MTVRILDFRRLAKQGSGLSAIFCAVRKSNIELLKSLIDAGVDLDGRDLTGGTPLHVACESGNMPVVVLLVEANAALDSVDCFDRTAAGICAYYGYYEVLQYLLSKGASTTAGQSLFSGNACLYPRVVETLVAAKADVNAICHDSVERTNQTALHLASVVHDPECIRLLLDAGAAIDAVDIRNESAIFKAIERNSWCNLTALLMAGARTDICNDRNFGPTKCAFRFCANACLLVLLAWQADDLDYESDKEGSYNFYVSFLDMASRFPRRHRTNAFPFGNVKLDIANERERLSKMLFGKITVPILMLGIALHSLCLPALVSLYIVDALYDYGQRVPMHKKWQLITTVKHF